MASTALERILPRSGTGTRRHSACAMRAAFTAASISASDALARRTTSRLSTGEMQTMSGMWLFLRHPRACPAHPSIKSLSKQMDRRVKPGNDEPLIPLEPAHQLPIRHASVVFKLLPLRGVHVVIDHRIAQRRAQHLRFIERLCRLAQSLRHLRQLRTVIGVARKGRIERQLLFDSLQPRRDQRRKGEIWIEVRAADAALYADRLASLPAQPKARGAIVPAPHRLGRREGADLETLVRIDVGRKK